MNAKNEVENLAFWKGKVVTHREQFEHDPSNQIAEMLLIFAEETVEEIEATVLV
jgi:hypothetical protein